MVQRRLAGKQAVDECFVLCVGEVDHSHLHAIEHPLSPLQKDVLRLPDAPSLVSQLPHEIDTFSSYALLMYPKDFSS